MNQGQNPYNQPPQSKWRRRLLGDGINCPLTKYQERAIPNWVVGASVIAFFVAMVSCWIVYGHPMETRYAVIASLSVLLFFYGGTRAGRSWISTGEKTFIKNVFVLGLCARLAWSMYCFFIFNPDYYGTAYGESADVEWYMPFAKDLAQWLRGGSAHSLSQIIDFNKSAIDDVGYPMWLAIGYAIWGDVSDVFMPFLIKCLVGAYCGVSIYKIAKRHFGEGTARMGSLFVALNPNMIYWCGNMFKETEMVFLCCLSVDLIDRVFTSGNKLSFKSLMPGLLSAFLLFFFRSALGIVMFLAMLSHIVMASDKVMSLGKKVIAGILVATTLFVGMGDRLMSQTERIFEDAQSDMQAQNMEWRSKHKEAGGVQQSFAKYASAAVFAPLIFTIPFPTFNVANAEQILQQQVSGGNYIRNIFSFFVIYVMLVMLMTGEWRKHVFILAYTCGYLACLVLSTFAHSSRFHMPVWPFLMLFAAYGIQIAKKNPRVRKWWPMVLVVEVVACLAWNWFKLKGRGMI